MLDGSSKRTFVSGPAGADGATWRAGAVAPDPSLGADGDFHLNTVSGDISQRQAEAYVAILNIKPALVGLGLLNDILAGAPSTDPGIAGKLFWNGDLLARSSTS